MHCSSSLAGVQLAAETIDYHGQDAHDTAIVRSVVDLAKTLNLSVTGEGIETAAQQSHLAELGCDQGQGFLFARPAPALALDEVLREGADRRAA